MSKLFSKLFSHGVILLTRAILQPFRVKTAVLRIGSEYGGWKLVPPQLEDKASEIFSFGLGEDASFDIEFCDLFGMHVHVCDPTPRAYSHFNEISTNFGKPKTTPYSNTGKQEVTSYPLLNVDSLLISFHPYAIWNQTGLIRLYFPSNPDSVSLSVEPKNANNNSCGIIDAKCIRVPDLVASLGIKKIELVKLDIEGAELPVLEDMLSNKIFPRQILVEFDFLLTPRVPSVLHFIQVLNLIWKSNYRMFAYDYPRNFSFIRVGN
jgi:FkbM family methyltransferase